MKIIGHRGAAGLALENTLESIRTAIKTGVDAIEIDVRITSDGQIVLSHDPNTARVSRTNKLIQNTPFKELRKLKLHNGEQIPTLAEVIDAVDTTPLVVEAKNGGWAPQLAKVLKGKGATVSVIAFNHDELGLFRSMCPDVPTYALERWSPFDVIHTAREKKLAGIDINFWVMNPLTYWLARRAGLEIIVFTVDRMWIARFLRVLYPQIIITTNYPDQLQSLRKQSKRLRKKT